MSEDLARALVWIGLAAVVVVVIAFLEVFLRTLTNRFGTPSRDYSRHVGGAPPR